MSAGLNSYTSSGFAKLSHGPLFGDHWFTGCYFEICLLGMTNLQGTEQEPVCLLTGWDIVKSQVSIVIGGTVSISQLICGYRYWNRGNFG